MFSSAVFLKTSSLQITSSNLSDSLKGLILIGKGGARIYKYFCKEDQKVGTSKEKESVTQSCLTLWDPMDCILPGSSVYSISHARILEWVAIPFSRVSSPPRDWTQVFCIAGRFFIVWVTWENQYINKLLLKTNTNKQTKKPRDLKLMNLAFFYV